MFLEPATRRAHGARAMPQWGALHETLGIAVPAFADLSAARACERRGTLRACAEGMLGAGSITGISVFNPFSRWHCAAHLHIAFARRAPRCCVTRSNSRCCMRRRRRGIADHACGEFQPQKPSLLVTAHLAVGTPCQAKRAWICGLREARHGAKCKLLPQQRLSRGWYCAAGRPAAHAHMVARARVGRLSFGFFVCPAILQYRNKSLDGFRNVFPANMRKA